jgi:uncharacterized damage-inducible protein DinB
MTTPPAPEIRATSRKLSAANFPATIRAHYPYWDAQYRPFLINAVEAFPIQHFDFKPRPELATARQLIMHIAEAEWGWIEGLVEGRPYEPWLVDHKDPSQGWVSVREEPKDHAGLLRLLEDAHRPTQRWFDRPTDELARVITFTPDDGVERRMTLHWIFDHVQEHEIHHRAQLNLYLRLLGIEPPSI